MKIKQDRSISRKILAEAERRGMRIEQKKIPMRDCGDVSRLIAEILEAHQQTSNSVLYFGRVIK